MRVVFDAAGTVLTRVDYGPFGEQLAAAPGAPNDKYAGLFRDDETGLDYAQARQYNPRTGRFTSIDPVYSGLFEPQRWNRYAYALNSPLTFVDPEGLQTANSCPAGSQYWEVVDVKAPTALPVLYVQTITFRGMYGQGRGGSTGTAGTEGSGGSTAPAPSPDLEPTTIKEIIKEIGEVMRCAAEQGSQWSVASLAGASPDNFLMQTFFGNDVASVSNLVTGPSDVRLKELPGTALAKGTEKALEASMNARVGPKTLLEIRRDSSWNYFARRSYAERLGNTTLGATLRFAGKFYMTSKLVYDAGTYAAAATKYHAK